MGAGMAPGKPPKTGAAAVASADANATYPEAAGAVEVMGVKRHDKASSFTRPVVEVLKKTVDEVPWKAPKTGVPPMMNIKNEGGIELITVKHNEASNFGTPVAEALKKQGEKVLGEALKTGLPASANIKRLGTDEVEKVIEGKAIAGVPHSEARKCDNHDEGAEHNEAAPFGTTVVENLKNSGEEPLSETAVTGSTYNKLSDAKSVNSAKREIVEMTTAASTSKKLEESNWQDAVASGKTLSGSEELHWTSSTSAGNTISKELVNQNLKDKNEHDDSKTPLLNAAKVEASRAKAKIKELRIAALKLNSEGVKSTKLTKAAKLASDTLDRAALLEYLKGLEEATISKKGNRRGPVPCPPLPRFYINPHLNVNPVHLSELIQRVKPGIDLVMINGSFAVPSRFTSGNCHIDAMNLLLFDIFMSVNLLLEGTQAAVPTMKLGLQAPKTEDAKADFRAAVSELRKTAHDIRASIVEVGGLPIREPALYWREAFPDVMV